MTEAVVFIIVTVIAIVTLGFTCGRTEEEADEDYEDGV